MANQTVLTFNPEGLKRELELAQDNFLTQGLNYQAAFIRVGGVIHRMKTDTVTCDGEEMKWYEALGYKSWKQFCIVFLEPNYKISDTRSHQLIAAWEKNTVVAAYIMSQQEMQFLSEKRGKRIQAALTAETTYRALSGLSPEEAVSVIEETQERTGKDIPSYTEIKETRMGKLSREQRLAILEARQEEEYENVCSAMLRLTVANKLRLLAAVLGDLDQI